MVFALSSLSPPTEYGIRLLEKAIPVSYLHPARKGTFPDGRKVLSDSECADRGDVLTAAPFIVDGVWESKESLRARWYGVEGSELA